MQKILEDIKSSLTSSAKVIQFPVKSGAGFNSLIDVLKMKKIDFDADGNASESDIPADLLAQAEEYRNDLVESIAETDEDLMNKYFEAGELDAADIEKGFKSGFFSRGIVPVLCASSKINIGVTSLLDFIVSYAPAPDDLELNLAEGSEQAKCDSNAPTSLFCI